MTHPHFHGKEALEHLIEARKKGRWASSEIHGVELPGHYSAAAEAAKETAFFFLLFWTLLPQFLIAFFLPLSAALLFWRMGRSALLGYVRLEKLHRLIEEERWEIEHHRPQEKEELTALYAAKGFSGKLLEEAIETLMADDNRLLQVMLEEELGLSLEAFEHPLKQACGASIAVFFAAALLWLSLFLPPWGFALTALLVIAAATLFVARWERIPKLPALLWNLALAAAAALIALYIHETPPF
ncbi:MAG: VIT1/CCC1 transporter family protein [Verrucomicrobiota bacterium]|nr:VIT1/CCC1 transporter family protein [Verrucomicrobiota bacterium]